MLINLAEVRRARVLRGLHGFGATNVFLPGVTFTNPGSLTLINSGLPPSGQWAGYTSPGPFPSDLIDQATQALADAQNTSNPDRSTLAANFVTSTNSFVHRFDNGLSFNNAFGVGDSNLQQAQQWANDVNQLISKVRQFVQQYNALPAVSAVPQTPSTQGASPRTSPVSPSGNYLETMGGGGGAVGAVESVASKKILGLPLWAVALVGLVAAGGVGFVLLRKKKKFHGYRRSRRIRRRR